MCPREQGIVNQAAPLGTQEPVHLTNLVANLREQCLGTKCWVELLDPNYSKERSWHWDSLVFAVSHACRQEAHAVVIGLTPSDSQISFPFHSELSS